MRAFNFFRPFRRPWAKIFGFSFRTCLPLKHVLVFLPICGNHPGCEKRETEKGLKRTGLACYLPNSTIRPKVIHPQQRQSINLSTSQLESCSCVLCKSSCAGEVPARHPTLFVRCTGPRRSARAPCSAKMHNLVCSTPALRHKHHLLTFPGAQAALHTN